MRHRRAGARAAQMALVTLDRMADGGIHDQLGGGFHRYAVDGIWLVPHFEKMLYDNALLASAYLAGYVATGTRATARSWSRRSATWSASCCCPRAAWPRRRTPTPRATRA